jgi:hypothetical protein
MHVCPRHQYQGRSALTMANMSHITRCGLPGIERVRFGMHAYTFTAAVTSSLQRWCRTLSRARKSGRSEGHNGLRIAGDARFLAAGDWSTFMEYEHAATSRSDGWHIVTLWSYARAQCNDQQMSEVMYAPHCALDGRRRTGVRGLSVSWGALSRW